MVIFSEVAAGVVEPEADRAVYQATYTAVNKNPWTSLSSLKVVQTFQMVGGSFTNFSAISVPTSGSREAEGVVPTMIKKGGENSNSQLSLRDVLKSGRIK